MRKHLGRFLLENYFKEDKFMNMKLLKLLNKDARYSVEDLAVMLGISEEEVASEIDQMEKDGVICGYKPVSYTHLCSLR